MLDAEALCNYHESRTPKVFRGSGIHIDDLCIAQVGSHNFRSIVVQCDGKWRRSKVKESSKVKEFMSWAVPHLPKDPRPKVKRFATVFLLDFGVEVKVAKSNIRRLPLDSGWNYHFLTKQSAFKIYLFRPNELPEARRTVGPIFRTDSDISGWNGRYNWFRKLTRNTLIPGFEPLAISDPSPQAPHLGQASITDDVGDG